MCSRAGLFLAGHQQCRDFASETAAGGDQPFTVRGEKIVVDARVVVKAFQLRSGGDA